MIKEEETVPSQQKRPRTKENEKMVDIKIEKEKQESEEYSTVAVITSVYLASWSGLRWNLVALSASKGSQPSVYQPFAEELRGYLNPYEDAPCTEYIKLHTFTVLVLEVKYRKEIGTVLFVDQLSLFPQMISLFQHPIMEKITICVMVRRLLSP
ncbi:RING/U-box protein [Perilla frutescens var. hirtella]|nr:RING/U-box protein [Perilla frutescens var. frutescens]KAH6787139.1 RING/U-box protein [Perilla frutescens var. hirtella]